MSIPRPTQHQERMAIRLLVILLTVSFMSGAGFGLLLGLLVGS